MTVPRVVLVGPADSEAQIIAEAADILRRGGLVAFPTETVYGLGANALDADSVGRIFVAKGRPPNNPLIVHVADMEQTRRVVADWPEIADRLTARFWPGPLTLVLPKHSRLPDIVTAGGPTVAVRMPAHPVARALIRAAGIPVAAPSANRTSELSPTTAEHVRRALEGRVDLILDAGPTPGGIESTVLDLTTSPPRLLRPGLVSVADLEAVIGPITVASRGVQPPGSAPLPSPGLMPRHYAPRTLLELADGDGSARVEELVLEGEKTGWVTWANAPDRPGVKIQRMARDPTAYASRLYAALHELDALGLDRIIVAAPPDTAEWAAINDRLQRAAR